MAELNFSQRKGLKPIKAHVQVDSMDADLRNAIWNVLFAEMLEQWRLDDGYNGSCEYERNQWAFLWLNYFKGRIDALSRTADQGFSYVERYLSNCTWNEVYDFVQASHRVMAPDDRERLTTGINDALKEEMAGYRLIGGIISDITSEQEMEAVAEAAKPSDKFSPVAQHIDRAIALAFDRRNPDPRNSIKESISAVESACRICTGEKLLKDALRKLPNHGITIHPAINAAFEKMYGYTSDAGGIRHSLLDASSGALDQADARFMLVTCSAFVNLLKERASEITS